MEKQYILNKLLNENGYDVLRLLTYHPEPNPIEKIWAMVENWVAAHNTTFKVDDVEQLCRQKFLNITPTEWKNACEHVKKHEFAYVTLLIDDALALLDGLLTLRKTNKIKHITLIIM